MNTNKLTINDCPVTATMEVIGGKWKLLIVFLISNDINRFGKLSMMMKEISRQMLTTQLRDLEASGIIRRVIYAEIPPRVEYFLTPKGMALMPVLTCMKDWGLKYAMKTAKELVEN